MQVVEITINVFENSTVRIKTYFAAKTRKIKPHQS